MNKIGILTFQLARNYGALLQCFALQEILLKLNYKVEVIDYRQEHINSSNKFNYKLILKYLINLRPLAAYYTIKPQLKRLRSTIKYKSFVDKYLLLSNPCDSNNIPDLPTYILGSDQIWSIDCTGNKLDEVYFGEFSHRSSSKLIGYAISTNKRSINIIGRERLKNYINKFSAISFREKTIADELRQLLAKNYPVVIDPTLLAPIDVYSPLINDKWSKTDYIVTYNLRGHKDIIYNETNKIAYKYRYKIIDVNFSKYSVADFVSLIKYSKIVVTSSFHATVFAIIFHKPLFSIKLYDGHDERYCNLLKTLGLDVCLTNLHFSEKDIPDIDWDMVESKLSSLREDSMRYLKNSLIK